MRLRQALKIRKAIGTDREGVYTDAQLTKASNCYDRMRSAKLDKKYWHLLMRSFGAAGRAEVFRKHPSVAFSILMSTPVEEWAGDPEAKRELDEWRNE